MQESKLIHKMATNPPTSESYLGPRARLLGLQILFLELPPFFRTLLEHNASLFEQKLAITNLVKTPDVVLSKNIAQRLVETVRRPPETILVA